MKKVIVIFIWLLLCLPVLFICIGCAHYEGIWMWIAFTIYAVLLLIIINTLIKAAYIFMPAFLNIVHKHKAKKVKDVNDD